MKLKRFALLGFLLAILLAVTTGCGISQEVYDQAVAERYRLQQERESANQEKATLGDEVTALTDNLTAAQSRFKNLVAAMNDVIGNNGTLSANITTASAEISSAKKTIDDLEKRSLELYLRAMAPQWETFKNKEPAITMEYPDIWDTSLNMQEPGNGVVALVDSVSGEGCVMAFGPREGLSAREAYDYTIAGLRTDIPVVELYSETTTVNGMNTVAGIASLDTGEGLWHQYLVCLTTRDSLILIMFQSTWDNSMSLNFIYNHMLNSLQVEGASY